MNQIHIFDSALQKIIDNKKIKDQGGYIGIPFPFESLNKNLGAIQEYTYYLITANSGISKSKFTRFVYIYNVYNFYRRTNYPVKIFYLPLEDNAEEVMLNMMCFYLKEHYDMNITAQHLSQLGDYNISSTTINKIKEARDYFSSLFDILEIIDYASTPSQIMQIGRDWAAKNGNIIYHKDEETKRTYIESYIKATPVHTIFILDNYSNIDADSYHKSLHEAVTDLSKNIFRKIFVRLFGFTVVAVQQQNQAKEKVQYANNGRLLYEKFEPALGDLADVLTTQRDLPQKYNIFLVFINYFYYLCINKTKKYEYRKNARTL